MALDIEKFKELQRILIEKDRKRLGITDQNEIKHVENEEHKGESFDCEQEIRTLVNNTTEVENNFKPEKPLISTDSSLNQNVSVVERLSLSCNEGSLEKEKQSFIDRLVNSENPLTFRSDGSECTMLRYGEYSPNNPHLRVAAAPYLGVGEYEQRRHLLVKQRQADYKEHINQRNEQIKNAVSKVIPEKRPASSNHTKFVQTDLQNIKNKLVQYDDFEGDNNNCYTEECGPESPDSSSENSNNNNNNNSANTSNKENSAVYYDDITRSSNVQRIDQRLTTDQNGLLLQKQADMDKPRSILSNRRRESPGDHLLSDYNHGYGSSCLDGFSYHDKYDEMQRERLKREVYQQELRNQIEEKRRLAEIRQEQERREQERENRRLEQQLLRMQEEQIREEQRRAIREEQSRRSSEEFLRRKQDLQLRSGYRKRLESEGSSISLRNNTNVASKLSHYSPPVSRRNPHPSYAATCASYPDTPTTARYCSITNRYDIPSPYSNRRDALNRMDLLNTSQYDNNSFFTQQPQQQQHHHHRDYSRFSRFDSLSRIDSLKQQQQQQDTLNRFETLSINADSMERVQRRHSATHQDLSMIRRSPKMQRRSSSSRLDDPLPIPVLKAHSPVARELRNSVAVNSGRHTSDAIRKLEDKWQVPAVQRNIISHGDFLSDGHSRSILTQLGAIRMQLQKEQLRMDETLRQRGGVQTKAVNFH